MSEVAWIFGWQQGSMGGKAEGLPVPLPRVALVLLARSSLVAADVNGRLLQASKVSKVCCVCLLCLSAVSGKVCAVAPGQ